MPALTQNARGEFGITALHHAAVGSKSPAVVKALLDSGADVNARAEGGWTPLLLAAAYSKNLAVVKTLLDAGADPKARTQDGKTPFDHAKNNIAIKGKDVYWRLNDGRFKK